MSEELPVSQYSKRFPIQNEKSYTLSRTTMSQSCPLKLAPEKLRVL